MNSPKTIHEWNKLFSTYQNCSSLRFEDFLMSIENNLLDILKNESICLSLYSLLKERPSWCTKFHDAILSICKSNCKAYLSNNTSVKVFELIWNSQICSSIRLKIAIELWNINLPSFKNVTPCYLEKMCDIVEMELYNDQFFNWGCKYIILTYSCGNLCENDK